MYKFSTKRGIDGNFVNDSTAYSSITWGSVSYVFKPKPTTFETTPITGLMQVRMKMLSEYISTVLQCYQNDLTTANEANKVHLIAPVLMTAISLLPRIRSFFRV